MNYPTACEENDEPTWLDKRRQDRPLNAMPIPSRDLHDHSVDPLTRDVAFNRHSMNDGHHVSPSDNGEMQVGTDGIRVALAQGIDEDNFRRILSMATRATIGLDLKQGLPGEWVECSAYGEVHDRNRAAYRADKSAAFETVECPAHTEHRWHDDEPQGRVPIEDWEEMLKGGLQTALETQTIVFGVGGVSRTATHQLVRSRRAAFHQQSQRASYMGDEPEVRIPESVWVNTRARQAFLEAVMTSWKAYRTICEEDISYQDARFVLQEGTTNFIMLEYPVREFLNVYAYRGCSMFQWEIVDVMRKCREALIKAHPWIEPYVKISCEKTGPVVDRFGEVIHEHHCTFQGWEDVEGQCPFSWAKHEARTFKPEFHRITRKGGES